MGIEDLELDPMAIGMGLIGGVISIYAMKNTTSGVVMKAVSFVLATAICYFMFSYIKSRG